MVETRITSLMAPLRACADGEMAPNLALMHLLTEAPDEESARTALNEMNLRSGTDPTARERLATLKSLWGKSPELFSLLKNVARCAEGGPTSTKDWAHAFDRAAAHSPEASVALYSLGDARLLTQITEELVACMLEWRLFAPAFRVLDLGCGTGRIASAIAPNVQSVVALDCSDKMVQLAKGKTADHRNVCVLRTSGEDLAFFRDGAFDTVLAIDSFPYLVEARMAEQHLNEIARVLNPGGRLLIMNYSYRGDLTRDRADVTAFAQQCGCKILRNGTSDLTLWDGRAFLLRKDL